MFCSTFESTSTLPPTSFTWHSRQWTSISSRPVVCLFAVWCSRDQKLMANKRIIRMKNVTQLLGKQERRKSTWTASRSREQKLINNQLFGVIQTWKLFSFFSLQPNSQVDERCFVRMHRWNIKKSVVTSRRRGSCAVRLIIEWITARSEKLFRAREIVIATAEILLQWRFCIMCGGVCKWRQRNWIKILHVTLRWRFSGKKWLICRQIVQFFLLLAQKPRKIMFATEI